VLREHFGAREGVEMKGGTVRLQEDMFAYVDVEKYIHLVRVGDHLWSADRDLSAEMYTKAAQMYGEVLPELQYIDWLEQFKMRLAEYQCTILQRLGQHSVRQGELESAAHYFEQWMQVEPLAEEACQSLLRVLVKMGRMEEARRRYSRFEKLCMDELDAKPSAETRQIVYPSI
jgi:DNA-binding SARP family transcriptional activator